MLSRDDARSGYSAGGGSGTFTVQVVPFAPGIFETTIGGQKYAIALRPDGSYISPSNPAHPGETTGCWLIGSRSGIRTLAHAGSESFAVASSGEPDFRAL